MSRALNTIAHIVNVAVFDHEWDSVFATTLCKVRLRFGGLHMHFVSSLVESWLELYPCCHAL